MKMERLIVQLPKPLKQRLTALRNDGYSVSGFVRRLLERELSKPASIRKRR